MRSKGKKRILPNEKMIMDILNGNPDAVESILSFYERYIRKIAMHPVYSQDGRRTGYFYDEDLAQELRVALSRSVPTVRELLIKSHFASLPVVVVFSGPAK